MRIPNDVVEDEREAPIHGDILEAVLSHVPLIHLVPASQVSNSWKHAVSTSLRHVNPVKPWLTLHTQSHHSPHVTNTFAYDPRSHAFLEIHAPHPLHSSALRSSHSSILYTLSPSELNFSIDPLHLTWHYASSPRVWRTDPIVVRIGTLIVIAGGACAFEDDLQAVEMYDIKLHGWVRCQSMPAILKSSKASTWLSVAVTGDTMHVTEKISGVTCTFDCNTMMWQGPYDLRPDQSVFCCVTGTVRGSLMIVGLVGDAEHVKGVKLWEVKGKLGMRSELKCEELGAMPKELVVKLVGNDGCGVVGSIGVNWIGNFLYVHNSMEPKEMVVCEISNDGGCNWSSMKNVVANDETRMRRMVFCGGDVGVEDLQRAVAKNCRFVEKDM
ncbi:hypothetical protein VNO77_03883 [Canavalia gladiata]|uniref:F-box domain-containing protein n=1 Tax=Canavalia gladiata TaxID=3824 RepID=A0AAN9MVN1_CANGL